MKAASTQLDASAARVATGTGDPVSERVTQMVAQQAFEANAAVVGAQNRLMRNLIDRLA